MDVSVFIDTMFCSVHTLLTAAALAHTYSLALLCSIIGRARVVCALCACSSLSGAVACHCDCSTALLCTA
jgi:hypothetical protein